MSLTFKNEVVFVRCPRPGCESHQLGKPDSAIVKIALSDHSLESLDDFCTALLQEECVTSIEIVTGEHDIEVALVVDGTRGLDGFLRDHVYSNDRVQSVRTKFIIRRFTRVHLPNTRGQRTR